jgi:hypothetical protein
VSVNYDAMAYIGIQASWISKHTKSTIWKTVDVVTNLIPSYTNICEKWLSLTKCNFVKKNNQNVRPNHMHIFNIYTNIMQSYNVQ